MVSSEYTKAKSAPLLYYPIGIDIDGLCFNKPEILQAVFRKDYFETMVLVEISEESIVKENVWKKLQKFGITDEERRFFTKDYILKRLQLSKDMIQNRRFLTYPDSSCVKVLLKYSSKEDAKAAVLKYHRTAEYKEFCAILVKDLISKIEKREKKIIERSEVSQQHQLVYFCRSKHFPKASDFEKGLTLMLSTVNREFLLCTSHVCTRQGVREAWIMFPSLSEAFKAEIAVDGTRIGTDVLSMRMVRNPVLVQHDLKVRNSLIGKVEEIRLVQRNFLAESDLNSLPMVGCSNIDCDACENARLKPKG